MRFHPKTRLFIQNIEINKLNFKDQVKNPVFTETWQYEILEFLEDFNNEEDSIEISTSGTTGKAKSFKVLKQKMINSAEATGKYFQLKPGDTSLLSLSGTYIASKMMLVRALKLGLTLYIVKPESNPLIINSLPDSIDFAPFVPLQLSAMLGTEPCREKLARIKKILLGGSSLSSTLKEQITHLPVNVYESFGMTETLSHVAIRQINGSSPAYFSALPGIKFETDQRNCLVIDAPHILDDKLITNDVVELLSPETFLWKGRFDLLINSGGIKINPEEIEKILEPYISQNYFIGSVPDEKLGEKMVLIIEDLPNNLHLCRLFDQLPKILPKFHIPKAIYGIPKFHRNKSGKIVRNMVESQIIKYKNKYLVEKES